MVTRSLSNHAVLCVAVSLHFLAAGCSVRNWWGEQPRTPVSIKAPSSTDVCPPTRWILAGTEEQSLSSFDCIAKKVDGIWDQIEGGKKDSISEAEIAALIRNRVIQVEGDREHWVTRAVTAKNLLGFKGRITKAQVDDWLLWARQNRAVARDLYRRFIDVSNANSLGTYTSERLTYGDLRAFMIMTATALQKLNMRLDSESFAHALVTVLDVEDHDLRQAASPAAEAMINAINLLCPTFSEKDLWISKSMGTCLVLAADHFKSGAAWFEFMANPIYELPRQQSWAIEQSMRALSGQVRSWFSQPTLAPIHTARWMEIARRLGARPPENLIDSLGIIRNFGGESNKDAIHPEAIPYLFNIAVQAQDLILKGMPYYLQAVKDGSCANTDAKYWTDCTLKDYSAFQTPGESFAMNLALTVKNLNNGIKGSPLDGRRFSRVMAMHAIAGRLIDVFDPLDDPERKGQRDHYISMSLDSESDPTFQFIVSGIQAGDTISRFILNIGRKLKQLPLTAEVPIDMSKWDIRGLARLVAMTNEILVQRPPEQKNVVAGILANLTNLNPGSQKLFLDQLSMTAILNTLTSLKDYRASMVGELEDADAKENEDSPKAGTLRAHVDYKTKEYLVDRDSVIRALPEILKADFPRTALACEQFGFEKSCGVTFDEILPNAPAGSNYILASDLDLLTIVAVAFEGVIDSCDNNGDGKLRMGLFDGDDELDCGFSRLKDVIQRLLQSKLVRIKASDEAKANAFLDILNSMFLTRIPAKVAMARGTTENLILHTLGFPLHNKATLGSMYGLVADILNPKEARRAASKR